MKTLPNENKKPVSSFEMKQVIEFIEIGSRMEALFKTAPKQLAHLRERLGESRPKSGFDNAADYNLFVRVGLILQGREEPMTMGELSKALDMPLSTATRQVDSLVANRYVKRMPDPGDRRIVRVALTERGRRAHRIIIELFRERLERRFRHLTGEERDILVSSLKKLIKTIEEEEA